jgi:flagellar biosynthesis protein FlhF
MQVKKFEAPTIQEALDNVKRELGPEAIILQTKKNKRGFGLMSKASVEVTAAVSDRSLQKKQIVEKRFPEPNKMMMQNLSAEKQANLIDKYVESNLEKAGKTRDQVSFSKQGKKITATRYIDIEDDSAAKFSDKKAEAVQRREPVQKMEPVRQVVSPPKPSLNLEEEVRILRKMIEDLRNAKVQQGPEMNQNPVYQSRMDSPLLQEAYDHLVISGIERRLAYSLIKKVSFELGPEKLGNIDIILDALAQEIMQTVEVLSPFTQIKQDRTDHSSSPSVVAIVGPTGVGKTLTLAKLASEAVHQRSLRVGLINLDHREESSFEQLGTYAKILNLPFRSVASLDDLRIALLDFQNLDLIMIDTSGCSQKDPDSLKAIQTSLKSVPDIQVFLVVSATTRDSELYDTASRFAVCGPRGLIVTKLDESSSYGSIYNVSQRAKLPLTYFTTGQKIPEDIEAATSERLTLLLLDF